MTYSFTSTETTREITGRRRKIAGTLNLSAYESGGVLLDAAGVRLSHRIVDIEPNGPSDQGWVVRYDKTNVKMIATRPAGVRTVALPSATGGTGVKGGTSANQVASGAAGVNDAFVHAAAALVTTVVNTGLTNPDTPRNLRVVLSSAAGGTLPANCGTCTIIGTDQFGNAITEAVALSPVNSVVLGAGGVVFVKSTKVFATVTSYQFSVNLAASVADIQASIGLGTKLGLYDPLNVVGDFKALSKNGTGIAAATYTADATVHAIEMGANLANNDQVLATYDCSLGQPPVGTNIGNVLVDVIGI
jgi:hypothetical protein